MNNSKIIRIIYISLIAVAAATMFSWIVALLPVGNASVWLKLLAKPGRFLFSSFHLASLCVPAFFVVAALALKSEPFRFDWIVSAVSAVVPMAFAAVALKIIFNQDIQASRVTLAFTGIFGKTVAAWLSAGAALASSMLILQLSNLLENMVLGSQEDVLEKPIEIPEEKNEQPSISTPGFNRLVMAAPINPPEAQEASEAQVDETLKEDVIEPSAEDDSQVDHDEPAIENIYVSFSRGQTTDEDDYDLDEDDYEAEDSYDEGQDYYEDDEYEDDDKDEYENDDDDELEEFDEIVGPNSDYQVKTTPIEQPSRIVKGEYKVPVAGLLNEYENHSIGVIGPETEAQAEALMETLREFNIEAEVTGIRKGPVITMFEILPAPGVKITKITSLSDNIALRLAAHSIRIVAPIPGKHAVGIEIPNDHRSLVGFSELLQEDGFEKSKSEIPLAIGKDIPGDAQIIDLAKTPHLLIAGATGSGKSVCVNSIICSILYKKSPEDVRMILIDPKIVELKFYNDIPHLLTPVITDPKKAFQALQYAVYEMERRYMLLDSMGVRDIASYNRKIKEKRIATAHLPYIVIVVDEFADLMATSGKELESTVARLCAMSRAVGIHVILATQRPSTDVITGIIKANIPSRIAFMVASRVDSRIIIDTGGAEKLLGRGDMLFTSAWDPFPNRMQGAFLSEEEVERIVEHVKTLGEPDYIDDEIFVEEDDDTYLQPELEDPLMQKAVDIVVSANKASASYLQRRLKIGYNRAARLVEEMERIGIVGPQNGSKARDVIGVPQE
ncbi:MAG: DNA translocase FtsK [Spirochaetaceae bacterium]|nr:MAG: DNA translocase FtsK [Spirochaetaceae bacterium]